MCYPTQMEVLPKTAYNHTYLEGNLMTCSFGETTLAYFPQTHILSMHTLGL